MIQLTTTDKCTGCMACVTSCPCSAIGVTQDELGSLYPQIDDALCVSCGKCKMVCPELNTVPSAEPSKAFAVWSLDPENRKTSASGGAAAVFYQKALDQGFWICGAEYVSDGRVVHTLRREYAAVSAYKQSKYVFSEMGEVYTQIKKQLNSGEKVLMISLPCKIAGLMQYLQKPYDNLYTVDIVCRGTPPGKLLEDHIRVVAPNADKGRLTFRQDNEFQFCLKTGGKIAYRKIGRTDTYLAAFLEGLSYREACYQCSYANKQRISDMTICDFWGLGAELPFDHPYTGAVSAVLINTVRGQEMFDTCRELLFVEERPVTEAVNGNAQLNAPTPRPENRDQFLELYRQEGFENAVTKLLRPRMKAEQKRLCRLRLRQGIRKAAGLVIKRYRG